MTQTLEKKLQDILRNLNTDLKIAVMVLVTEKARGIKSVEDILGDILKCTNPEVNWSVDASSVRQICEYLNTKEIFSRFKEQKGSRGEPQIFFSYTEGGLIYRKLAYLALRTFVDNNVSAFDVLGTYGGGSAKNKGVIQRFKTLISFYINEKYSFSYDSLPKLTDSPFGQFAGQIISKTYIQYSTLENVLGDLKEAGLINRDGNNDLSNRYRVIGNITEFMQRGRNTSKCMRKLIELVVGEQLAIGQEFSSNQLYKDHFKSLGVERRNLERNITRLSKAGYLSVVPGGNYINSLNGQGKAIVESLFIPIYNYLIDGRVSDAINAGQDLFEKHPLLLPRYIRETLNLYSETGPNIKKVS